MIKEALELILGLAEPQAVTVHQTKMVKVIRRGEKLIRVTLDPEPRANVAHCLDTLIALANRFKTTGTIPAVFHGASSVIALLDDGEEENRPHVSFALNKSDQWKVLEGLAGGSIWFDQKNFIRLLKITLEGSLNPFELLNKVREVRFESGAVQKGTVKRADESLGISRSASATSGEGDFPEEVTLTVPVYSNPKEDGLYPIVCAVEIDPLAAKFQLVPLPGRMELAQQLAIASIAQRLREGLTEGIPIYHGAPTA